MAQSNEPEEKFAIESQDSEQVSKTESSADEQKENVAANSELAAGSAKSVPDLPDQPAPDVLSMDVAEIFQWMEEKSKTPNQLKKTLDQLDTRIDLINNILTEQNAKARRIPGVDKRIETMELYDTRARSR